jgi:predicted AAA+ superfamily ATPase
MKIVLGHPVCGPSWEGFVIENLLLAAPERTQASFYRTAAGAEIDLVLDFGGKQGVWAIEVKRSLKVKLERGFYHALEDLKPKRACVVYAGEERYPLGKEIEVMGLRELAQELAKLS